MLKYIRSTQTRTGLEVRAHLVDRVYEKGAKITDAQMQTINISHAALPPLLRRSFI